MNIVQQVERYAKQDISAIIKIAENKCGVKFKLKSINIDDSDYSSDEEDAVIGATAIIECNNKQFDFYWEYLIDDDNIYIEDEDRELALSLCNRYKNSINSSIRINASSSISPITAADDDFENDNFEETVDDNLDDEYLDELSDKVDDIEEQVNDIQQDDVNIQIENNISGHYIAECDSCHGIFISAVIESDQMIEKISGVCPLCSKETDQYLKWVIKDAEESNDKFER